MPRSLKQFSIQFIAYAMFFGVIFHLSDSPAYHYLYPDQAEIKLAFKHTSQREQECHTRSPEELAKLPPNMRRPQDCPRNRAPIAIELLLDDRLLATKSFIPPGLSHDMATFVYAKFALPAGRHKLTMRMRDRVHTDTAFDYVAETVREWIPGQAVVIGFSENQEKIIFD
ncbi:MAG: hypothetical protein HQL94_03180 [Magnetococcales bacterium]|nr:hypothetical protein [Magnetococcales bacterium]MBF0439386.1 hypothetical protein [Magnetococcales bacterium]